MPSDSEEWIIRVQGYGTFTFKGTETEAEEMRAHKSRWEHGMGMKWRSSLVNESDRIATKIAEHFDAGEGVPQSLFSKRFKALKMEPSNAG